MKTSLSDGAQTFVAGLGSCSYGYELRNQIVVFRITPVDGAHVDQPD